jgi:N-acetylmuramoyl-L-alanine amidase
MSFTSFKCCSLLFLMLLFSQSLYAQNIKQPALKKAVGKHSPLKVIVPAKLRITTIVIDAGHGGKDPGTIGSKGSKEKDIVLAIALRLAALINKETNMRAILTRSQDQFVYLRKRLKLARKGKADIFISLHADSFLNDQSSGVSVYALSAHGASSEAARWLAQRENYSELGGAELNSLGNKNIILRSILMDLAQSATIADSLRLGHKVLKALDKVAKLHTEVVDQAPFVVLKSPDIPSILIETGYLSNPMDEEHLRDKVYRGKLAQAILSGIRAYVTNHYS